MNKEQRKLYNKKYYEQNKNKSVYKYKKEKYENKTKDYKKNYYEIKKTFINLCKLSDLFL